MDNQITYEEALAHFQAQGPMWDALCSGIMAMREDRLSDLVRNANTPNCNERCDAKVIGQVIALDAIVHEFGSKIDTES